MSLLCPYGYEEPDDELKELIASAMKERDEIRGLIARIERKRDELSHDIPKLDWALFMLYKVIGIKVPKPESPRVE